MSHRQMPLEVVKTQWGRVLSAEVVQASPQKLLKTHLFNTAFCRVIVSL